MSSENALLVKFSPDVEKSEFEATKMGQNNPLFLTVPAKDYIYSYIKNA